MPVRKRLSSAVAAAQPFRSGPRLADAADMVVLSPVPVIQARLVEPGRPGLGTANAATKYPPAIRLLIPVAASLFCWLGMGWALLY